MTDIGLRAVIEAQLWIGTPYVHQASVRGAGADCLGLIRGVWRAVIGAEPQAMPAYTPAWSEAEAREDLWAVGLRWMQPRPLDQQAMGDVLLFRMRDGGVAKHLGLQSAIGPDARFIHAYTGHGVLESPLSDPWARRIVARFALPSGV